MDADRRAVSRGATVRPNGALHSSIVGTTVPFTVLGARRRFDEFTGKIIASKIDTFPFWALFGPVGVNHT